VFHFKKEVRPLRFEGHNGEVLSLSVSADGNMIASASMDKTVRLWKNTSKAENAVIKAHTGPVRSVSFSSDDQHLVTASDDKVVKIWSVRTRKFHSSLEGHTNWVRTAAFAPDNACLLVSGGDDKLVKLWDTRQKKYCTASFQDHVDIVNKVLFHPDGSCIAACSDDNSIKLWDIRTNRLLQHYDAHSAAVTNIAFNDGDHILSSSLDGLVKVWDLREGRLVHTIQGHEGAVLSCDISPRNGFFATGGQDCFAHVWKSSFDSTEILHANITAPPLNYRNASRIGEHNMNLTPPAMASTVQRPSTAAPSRPATSTVQRPSTSAPSRPAASTVQRPSTAAPSRPAAPTVQRPSTAAPSRPAAPAASHTITTTTQKKPSFDFTASSRKSVPSPTRAPMTTTTTTISARSNDASGVIRNRTRTDARQAPKMPSKVTLSKNLVTPLMRVSMRVPAGAPNPAGATSNEPRKATTTTTVPQPSPKKRSGNALQRISVEEAGQLQRTLNEVSAQIKVLVHTVTLLDHRLRLKEREIDGLISEKRNLEQQLQPKQLEQREQSSQEPEQAAGGKLSQELLKQKLEEQPEELPREGPQPQEKTEEQVSEE